MSFYQHLTEWNFACGRGFERYLLLSFSPRKVSGFFEKKMKLFFYSPTNVRFANLKNNFIKSWVRFRNNFLQLENSVVRELANYFNTFEIFNEGISAKICFI
jgi:hypothetical protein